MWHKVNELYEKGLNKCQISQKLGLNRRTIRKYIEMSYDEFIESNACKRIFSKKLDCYESFVKELLLEFPFLSSAQVHDRIKEHYSNYQQVDNKTVYNYVKYVRKKFNIPHQSAGKHRDYEMLPTPPLGKYAQVDFGEKWMKSSTNRNIKVYFFVMVMSYSRKKYVEVSLKPFNTDLAIYAHERAFEYFKGIPHRIVYDQDKVFISSENLGDIILTSKFDAFVKQLHFRTIFCRKEDPESKGKVENAVKYIKYNFLSGRYFTDIESLQSDCLAWLERTGNGTENGTTKQIPTEAFKEEQEYLLEYRGTPKYPISHQKKIHLRKDNTISYRGNYYTVPTGTYRNNNSCVWVEESGNELIIYNGETGKIITNHPLCHDRGKRIYKTDHARIKHIPSKSKENHIKVYVGNEKLVATWLETMFKTKRRYYNDNLDYVVKRMIAHSPEALCKALNYCIQSKSYNACELIEATEYFENKPQMEKQEEIKSLPESFPEAAMELPEYRDITTYKNYF